VDSCIVSEVSRCVHVGLLCVQQYPEDRPTMADVILMLGSEMMILDEPKEPCFTTRKESAEANSSSSGKDTSSNYEMTMSSFSAR